MVIHYVEMQYKVHGHCIDIYGTHYISYSPSQRPTDVDSDMKYRLVLFIGHSSNSCSEWSSHTYSNTQ